MTFMTKFWKYLENYNCNLTSLNSPNSIAKFKKEPSLLQIMTLPKGYKPSVQTGSGSSRWW